MSMLDILKKFDSVQSKTTALNEDLRAVTLECGGVSEGPAMQSPITLNITMSSADQMAQLMKALSMINGGNDQVDGLKNNGTPVDDPSIPGRDDVEGDTDLNQGALGALAGGALGTGLGLATGQGAFGTTIGALSGAAAGDSLTDTDYDDPSIPGRDDVEGDVDLNQDIGSILSAGVDLINKGASAIASSDLGQKAISSLGQASDWAAGKGADIGSSLGSTAADLLGPDRLRSLAGNPTALGYDVPDAALKAGAALKGAEIGSTIGKYAPAAAAGGAGLAGASMLGGDNDDKQESSGDFEKSTTEPDEKYWDHDTMVNKLSGGINGKKRMYKPASQGDNAMAVESMKARLLKALDEASKKAKPDFLDMDKDGDKKEPMKKAVADKKGDAPKKGKVPPQFQKNVKEAVNETADLNRMKQFLKRLNG